MSEILQSLRSRTESELRASFDSAWPIVFADARDRLDLIGGVSVVGGAAAVSLPTSRAFAVAIQPRVDRTIHLIDTNRIDDHVPFTLTLPTDSLSLEIETLRRALAEPGRSWAARLVGTLAVLARAGRLKSPGYTIATRADSPNATLATVALLRGLLDSPESADDFARRIEQSFGDQIVLPSAASSRMLRPDGVAVCPRQSPPALLDWPADVGVVAIELGVSPVDQQTLRRIVIATHMAHRFVLERIKRMAAEANATMIADPTAGLLANLDQRDYKQFFRGAIPEKIRGRSFVDQFEVDSFDSISIEADVEYELQAIADHQITDARRCRQFADYVREAVALPADSDARTLALDKAGHLLYASHHSAAEGVKENDARADAVLELVRRNESAGLYGARQSLDGRAVILLDESDSAANAVESISAEISRRFDIDVKQIAGLPRVV